MPTRGVLTLVVMALVAFATPQAHGTLIGDVVGLTWHQPDPATLVEDDGQQVVGPAVEYSSALSGIFNADIGTSTLTMRHNGNIATTPCCGIPYFDFTLTDLTKPIIAAVLDPSNTVSGLAADEITVANGGVSVDLAGFVWQVGQVLVLDIQVPEPSSLALLGTGLVSLVIMRRRRHIQTQPPQL